MKLLKRADIRSRGDADVYAVIQVDDFVAAFCGD